MSGRQRVGFIGVGLMGHGMAKNILANGFPLTVLAHRNRAPVEDLLARGAAEAKSAAELARDSDVVMLCVTGTPQVEDAIYRADGVLAGLRRGTVVVDCSTAEPGSTMKVAAAVADRGGRYLDAPLVRTPKEAAEGKLGMMVGGDRALLEEVRPVLACTADTIVHAGPLGAGHRMKLLANFLAIAGAAAVAEGLCAAIKLGVDLEALHAVVTAGGGDSVMFRRMSAYARTGDASSMRFGLANALKDLRYYAHMAEAAPVTATMAATAQQILTLAANLGSGDEHLPQLLDILKRVNGVK